MRFVVIFQWGLWNGIGQHSIFNSPAKKHHGPPPKDSPPPSPSPPRPLPPPYTPPLWPLPTRFFLGLLSRYLFRVTCCKRPQAFPARCWVLYHSLPDLPCPKPFWASFIVPFSHGSKTNQGPVHRPLWSRLVPCLVALLLSFALRPTLPLLCLLLGWMVAHVPCQSMG